MKKFISSNDSSGFVLVIVMIAILTMTFFLLTGNMSSATAVKVSGNYTKTVDAFNIAEAGLFRARPLLENQSFTGILQNYSSGYLIASTNFNNLGTYNVKVANDTADNGGATTDTNSIIQVTSQGVANSGASTTIKTWMQLVGGTNPVQLPASPAGGESASVMCGSGVSMNVSGSAIINGDNFDLPATCSSSSCTPTGITNANVYDVINESTISCSGCGAIAQQNNAGAGLNCSAWKTLSNQLGALNASNPNVVVLTGTKYDGVLNDCAHPKIIIISTTASTYELGSNTFMCGTIVVASDTLLSPQGNSTMVGLMLFMGGNSATKGIETDPQGTSKFYGKMIFGSSAETNTKILKPQGDSVQKFSSDAVGFALQAINNAQAGGGSTGGGQLLTVGWEESY